MSSQPKQVTVNAEQHNLRIAQLVNSMLSSARDYLTAMTAATPDDIRAFDQGRAMIVNVIMLTPIKEA